MHAVIGPNGAGKTTLINQISGLIPPDAGTYLFAGADVTALPPQDRALRGIARTFQITSILPGFSVLENVALAVQARSGSSLRFVGSAAAEPTLNVPAMAALDRPASPTAQARAPANFRTARNARSSLPSRSPCSRGFCCSTSRWPASAATRPSG